MGYPISGFRPEADGNGKGGAMLSGLVLMVVDETTGNIIHVIDDGVDSDELDDLMDWDTTSEIVQKYLAAPSNTNYVASLYYFGNDEDSDGAMKSGATSVTIDGDTYNFMFNKTGGAGTRGYGLTGVDDNKYIYKLGCRIKAGSDDKYQVVSVTPGVGTAVDLHAKGVGVKKVSTNGSTGLRSLVTSATTFVNDNNESVSYVDVSAKATSDGANYYLVNTSGNIQKSKVAAKDGDDWYFYVKDRAVKLYTSDKNLDKLDLSKGGTGANGVSEKWDSRPGNATTGAGIYVSDLTTGY